MAKKKSNSTHKSVSQHEHGIKALGAFLILSLAFGVLLVFYRFQENIFSSNFSQTAVVLAVFLFALLVWLLFLINPQKRK